MGQLLVRHGATCAAAESCTGGLLCASMTQVPGSSQWFEGGLVTYSSSAKKNWLGVPDELLVRYGAVSAPTALAMVAGLGQRSKADLKVSVTGLAGPATCADQEPVGTVFIGVQWQHQAAYTVKLHFKGGRVAVQSAAVRYLAWYLCRLLR